MENISDHITYAEAVKSNTATRHGVDNTPNEKQISNMKMVAINCFEPLRKWWGKAIGASSFFRSLKVNELDGGSQTSAHCAGIKSGMEEAAIDLDADIFNNGIDNAGIFNWLRENVEFDQLIWEFGDATNPAWVHVSYRKDANRKQVLRAIKENGVTKYIPFI